MDRCAYEGCQGSPKNSLPGDKNLAFCDYHLSEHLKTIPPGSSIPNLKDDNLDVSGRVADQVIKVAATVSKVMLTGKDMFEVIYNKLSELTDQLLHRQSEIMNLAKNSGNQELDKKLLEDFKEIGLKFRNKDEFKKMVDQHFSKDDATADFSLFTKDIENFKNHLEGSNKLLEELRSKSNHDAKSREEVIKMIEISENSSKIEAERLEAKIMKLEKELNSTS